MTGQKPGGAAAGTPGGWLLEVWEQLTARGFIIDEPAAQGSCQCYIRNLLSAQCEMDLLVTGALVWEYLPLSGTSPEQAARLALALLRSTSPAGRGLPPARYPGPAFKDAAGQMLAACGMAVGLVDIRYDEVCTEAIVTNPAEPARGHVRISDGGTIRWECSPARPGSAAGGLAPPGIAQAIATALAGYRIAGQSEAAGSGPGEAVARSSAAW